MLAIALLGKLHSLSYSRDVESRADITGSDVCAATGYNPWGLVWLFQDFKNAKPEELPQLLSDHPNIKIGSTRWNGTSGRIQRSLEIQPGPEVGRALVGSPRRAGDFLAVDRSNSRRVPDRRRAKRRKTMSSFSDVVASGLETVRRSWGWFLVFGILLTVLGVVCVGKAQTATTFSILALGWVLLISGVLWLVNSFYAFSWHGFFLYLLNAIIRGVTGYLLIRHPDAGAEG